MDAISLICFELVNMIFAHDWQDVRIYLQEEGITYAIYGETFERDTDALCSADGWDDFGPVYGWMKTGIQHDPKK